MGDSPGWRSKRRRRLVEDKKLQETLDELIPQKEGAELIGSVFAQGQPGGSRSRSSSSQVDHQEQPNRADQGGPSKSSVTSHSRNLMESKSLTPMESMLEDGDEEMLESRKIEERREAVVVEKTEDVGASECLNAKVESEGSVSAQSKPGSSFRSSKMDTQQQLKGRRRRPRKFSHARSSDRSSLMEPKNRVAMESITAGSQERSEQKKAEEEKSQARPTSGTSSALKEGKRSCRDSAKDEGSSLSDDGESWAAQEETPEGPTIHIPDVPLQIIFQHLGVKDLLDCRLVNRQWAFSAQTVLQSRRTFISLDKMRKIRVREGEPDESEDVSAANIKYLSERLEKDKYFPFLGIIIHKDDWNNNQSVQGFCRNFGKFFHRLYLKKVPSHVAGELLGGCFTNVRDLLIEPQRQDYHSAKRKKDWDKAQLKWSREDINLPTLEWITVVDNRSTPDRQWLQVSDYSLVTSVVRAAPNLKKIDNFYFFLYPCVKSCGKLHTLTDICIDYEHSFTRTHYQDLALNPPSLTSLKVCNTSDYGWYYSVRPVGYEQQQAMSERNILAASQDTLRHLAIEQISGPLPLLAELKTLWILQDFQTRTPYRIFDTDDPPATYFPALETVRIFHYMYDAAEQYFQYRHGHCQFDTVQTLELPKPCSDKSFHQLMTIFPNVKKLRVDWHFLERGGRPNTTLWTCSWNLTELEICDYPGTATYFPEFESFVTGIPTEKLKILRGRVKEAPLDPAEINALRTEPSICNLKGLKKFRVLFWVRREVIRRKTKEESKADPVAFSSALGLMPDLNTTFEYDFRAEKATDLGKLLAPYTSVVSIQHRENERIPND